MGDFMSFYFHFPTSFKKQIHTSDWYVSWPQVSNKLQIWERNFGDFGGIFCKQNTQTFGKRNKISTECFLSDTCVRGKNSRNHTVWRGENQSVWHMHLEDCPSSLPPVLPSWAIEINCLWSNQQKLRKLKSGPQPAPPPSPPQHLPPP